MWTDRDALEARWGLRDSIVRREWDIDASDPERALKQFVGPTWLEQLRRPQCVPAADRDVDAGSSSSHRHRRSSRIAL